MPCPCPPSPLPSLFPVRQGWAVPEASSSGHPSPRGHDRLGGGLHGDGTRPGWPVRSTPHPVEGQLRSPADPGCGLKLRLRGALQEAGPDTCARWAPQMHPRRPSPVSFVLTPATHPHSPLSPPCTSSPRQHLCLAVPLSLTGAGLPGGCRDCGGVDGGSQAGGLGLGLGVPLPAIPGAGLTTFLGCSKFLCSLPPLLLC